MIRVLLVEDMTLVRGALVALLAYERDIEVVAELDRGAKVLPAALSTKPDVAVIDVGLADMDGLTTARKLRDELPQCRTILLTGMRNPHILRQALDAKIRGFVVKDAPPGFLAESIRRVANGGCVIDSELALSALSSQDNLLTLRETEVLTMAAEGASAQEIARRLCLAAGTVRNYLSVIISKLGARNRLDAVRIARDAGWL